jgi:hypothetical protein
MQPATLREVFVSQERLHDPWQGRIEGALVHTNIETLQPGFGRHMVHDIYPGRDGSIESLDLGQLPSGAVVITDHDGLLVAGGEIVAEQLSPSLKADPAKLAAILATTRPIVTVGGEVMLGVRYGMATWGHWLGELLPRIVVVENRYPGRFRYALPRHVVQWEKMHPAYRRIHESLAAYGIGDDRIVQMEPGIDYRFTELYALTPVWMARSLHPQAGELMRRNIMLLPPEHEPEPRVALLRTDTRGRNIENIEALRPMLRGYGFVFIETAPMPFVEQVAVFRGAQAIAAVLGSAMTGLIYAPRGVRVLSMAPESFGDNFFYGLTQERQGSFVDLRGTIGELDPARRDNSGFRIEPDVLAAGLEALFPPDPSL